MKEAKTKDLDRLIAFLKENVDHCIYIYIDVIQYGLDHKYMKVWFAENDSEITSVAMKYYDSFQLFSKNVQTDREEIIKLLEENSVKTISGDINIIQSIETKFNDDYDVNYGIVVKETKYKKLHGFEKVEIATKDDCPEIAHLMCQDSEFGENYDEDILIKQLDDRMTSGMGRNFVIRENGEIVGHVATFAETDDLAVQSGLMVSEKCSNVLCGLILHEYMKGISLEAGKTVYAFRIKEEMKKYEKSPGTIICGQYGKMTRRGE